MTTAREDARDAGIPALPIAERSAVAGIRGLRWWVVVLVALVLAVAGVSGDLLQSGELGIFYTVCFPVGGILAAVWVRRGEMFATSVQPPLLLAVSVPIALVATGSLPRTGGLTALVLAFGGPMINGFPVMAITTAVCLALAFVRSRLQPITVEADEPDIDRIARDRDRPPRDRGPRDRPERDRSERDRPDRDRPERPSRPADRRPDERRPDDRRGDDRRGDATRPARPGRPTDAPKNPARRPAEEPAEPRGEGFGPGVYRVPRPPQDSRPGGRPAPDAPRRPKRPGPPPPQN